MSWIDQEEVDNFEVGGDVGHILFLCTTPDFRLPPEEAARTWPARILTCRVDVPHAGRP